MDTKILLDENQIPKQWYNIIPDMPGPLSPVIHPGTLQPVTPDDLLPLFPMGLIEQEVSTQRWIDIPDEVREVYKLWRPAPLYRAHRLEKVLGTPAKIYYKYEGAHRPVRTSRIRRFRRHTTTRFSVPSGLPPKPAPVSGVRPCRLPAKCSALPVRSTW